MEMCVKMNMINKSKRKENSMSDFLSSPISPVMANLAAASSAEESVSLALDKKRESLESKLLRASSEKISCLQETVPLLNQSISKENHDQLETHKALKILLKAFKKQMKENKSLTSKLLKKRKNENSSYDFRENEVLFVKNGARVLELLLDTSCGTKWCKCSL